MTEPPGLPPELPPDPFRPPDQPYAGPPPAAPGPPPYGQPPPYGAPLPSPARRNGLGTAALVLGIVAILPCSWMVLIPAVLAVVFGFVGRGRVRRQEATNRGAATTGIVLGSLALVPGVALWGLLLVNVDEVQRFNDCNRAHAGDQTAQDQCARDFVHDVFGVDTSR